MPPFFTTSFRFWHIFMTVLRWFDDDSCAKNLHLLRRWQRQEELHETLPWYFRELITLIWYSSYTLNFSGYEPFDVYQFQALRAILLSLSTSGNGGKYSGAKKRSENQPPLTVHPVLFALLRSLVCDSFAYEIAMQLLPFPLVKLKPVLKLHFTAVEYDERMNHWSMFVIRTVKVDLHCSLLLFPKKHLKKYWIWRRSNEHQLQCNDILYWTLSTYDTC